MTKNHVTPPPEIDLPLTAPDDAGTVLELRPVRPSRHFQSGAGRWAGAGVSLGVLRALAPVVLVLCVWQLGVAAGFIDKTFFPAPTTVLSEAIKDWSSARVPAALGITVKTLFIGFVLAAVPGTLIGLLAGRNQAVRAVVDPLIAATYPIPAIAVLPLLLVIFGLGAEPIVVLAALISFFPIVINSMAGAGEVDPTLLRMAKNAGASRVQIFFKVTLPASLPSIFAGWRLGLGLALLGAVSGEFVTGNSGIGALIWSSWQTYQILPMYGDLTAVVLTGYLLTYGMLFMQRRFFGWASTASRQ
jgi:NitT/TauT family transport system permease protein